METRNTGSIEPSAALRQIPAVEALLRRPALEGAAHQFGRRRVLAAARTVTGRLREKLAQGGEAPINIESLESEVIAAARSGSEYSLRPVINATGVILHTNLGRAPLASEAIRHAVEVAARYSNLEYDLTLGERGKRDVHFQQLFAELLGAGPALVVNNNAAAVFLVLNTLAEGAEVIVSRGELVEIGGAFRIPDICAKSGAVLREAGTTNRTRAADYEAAITDRTRMLLRVHPSNFRMVGFTERPRLHDLAALAHSHGLILMEDLGSGCLTDLAPFGLRDEPIVSESLKAGVDVVTFSGDKLLGGPQAGLILGRQELLQKIRKNSLYRAFRAGKLTVALLEATLALYLREDYDAIPAQRMIRASKEEIMARAKRLADQLSRIDCFSIHLRDGDSVAGGGSSPGQHIPTQVIAITHAHRSAEELARDLRRNHPPVITRVEDEQLVLDLRTVLDDVEESEIVRAFEQLGH
ncbi:MAG: L-seryl-tRNA(Sec) selenium transferase [Terriglobia bacterium]